MSGKFNEDFLIEAPDYAAVLNETVLPELEQAQESITVNGTGGCPLFCSLFRAENPVGTVVIVHGFTENAYKYAEMIYSLLKNRFSVIAYDQRGHGRSGRTEGLPHPSVTHVERFEDYVEDLRIICQTVLKDFPKPWTVFSHSMGGAVTALYLEKYQDTFSAASFCAPMIAPATGGLPRPFVSFFCRSACLIGRGKHYPFFMKPYSGPEAFETSSAADPARFAWYDRVKSSTPAYQNSVPSYRWTAVSVAVTRKILSPGAPESISCPVLLSTADVDFSVLPDPQIRFISRVPKGSRVFVKGSRHEIFRSANAVLFPWWHDIILFLKEAQA